MLLAAICAAAPVLAIGGCLVLAKASNHTKRPISNDDRNDGTKGGPRKRKVSTPEDMHPTVLGGSCAGCSVLQLGDDAKRMRLHKITDVPSVMQRPFILTGYRFGLTNIECCASLFTLTNELLNQWTHAVPLLWALWAAADECSKYTSGHLTAAELAVSMAFFGSIIFCFTSSVVFHTFGCRSSAHCWDLCAIDWVGVMFGTLAGYFPTLYYGFQCDPGPQMLYSCTTVVTMTAVLVLMCAPQWRSDAWRSVRLASLGSLMLLGPFPVAHYTYLHWDLPDLNAVVALPKESYTLLAIGLFFYLSRFPESTYPGIFDLFFYSHMWWHVAIAGSFLSMYIKWSAMRDYRNLNGCPVGADSNHTLAL